MTNSNEKQSEKKAAANLPIEVTKDILDAAPHADVPNPDAPDDAAGNRRGFFARVGAAFGGLAVVDLLSSRSAEAGWWRRKRCATVSVPCVPRPMTIAEARRQRAFQIRVQAAQNQYCQPVAQHRNNGDECNLPNFIGNFSKTLPHNDAGEVDPAAYRAMRSALCSQDFNALERVPAGGPNGALANPLGGLFYSIDGPDSSAIAVDPPPSISSPQWAAQMAQLYWMALLRDVNFDDYDSPDAQAAREDLAKIQGYFTWGPHTGNTIGANELFRAATRTGGKYPGTDVGPMVSQFLLREFNYDAIPVDGKIEPRKAGVDFMTQWDNYLAVQNGAAPFGGFAGPPEAIRRFPINARDLGWIAASDTIFSVYFRAAKLLGFFLPADAGNPYTDSERQFGFATFGLGHLMELIGKAHKSERHAWFTKWNVNRYLRPEAGGARVHQVKANGKNYPLDPQLLASDAVQRTFDKNGTYLLPQLLRNGSPTHPSFTAGHAISAGACVTILKAWVDLSVRFVPELPAPFPGAAEPFFRPKQTNADGTALQDYMQADLTLEGELNKLCHNLSWGRDMSGVHWPADNYEGNYQGEQLAINLLQEEACGYPEPFEGFHLRKFDGSAIIIRAGAVIPAAASVKPRAVQPDSKSTIRQGQMMRTYGGGG